MPNTNTPHRILCVDDRVSSLDVRRALLKQMGYDVLIASDPPAALAILDNVNVDLVILDYSFPGHISGKELAYQVRAKIPGLPLIMLSGYPDLPDSVAESVDLVLLKGAAQPRDLLQAITQLLHTPVSATGSRARAGSTSLREAHQQLSERTKQVLERSRSNISDK